MMLVVLSFCNARTADLYMTKNFQAAYQNQTRSLDGMPGTAYWQNRANYIIDVSLDPSTRIIAGTETIQYTNNSPDSLNYLIIHLFPNVYKKGTARDFDVTYDDETDGVILNRLTIDKREIDVSEESTSIEYLHNDIILYLPLPLLPGQRWKSDISWQYTLNRNHICELVRLIPAHFLLLIFIRELRYMTILMAGMTFFTAVGQNFTMILVISMCRLQYPEIMSSGPPESYKMPEKFLRKRI